MKATQNRTIKKTIINELTVCLDSKDSKLISHEISLPYVKALLFLIDGQNVNSREFIRFYIKLLKINSLPFIPLQNIEFLLRGYKRNPNFFKHINYFVSLAKKVSLPSNIWESIILSITNLNHKSSYFKIKAEMVFEIISSNIEHLQNYNLSTFCKNMFQFNEDLIDRKIYEYVNDNSLIALGNKSIRLQKLNNENKDHIFGLFIYWAKKIIKSNFEVSPSLNCLFSIQFVDNKKWLELTPDIEEFLDFIESKVSTGYLIANYSQYQIKKLSVLFHAKKELFLQTHVTANEIIEAEFILEPFFKKFIIPKVFFKHFYDLDTIQHSLLIHALKGESIRNFEKLPLKMDKKSCHELRNQNIAEKQRFWDYFAIARFQAEGVNKEFALKVCDAHSRSGGSYDFWIESLILLYHKGLSIRLLDIACDYIANKVLREEEPIDFKRIQIHTLIDRVHIWHRQVLIKKGKYRILPKSTIKKFSHQKDKKEHKYIIKQLYSSLELFIEGQNLHHCIYTYTKACLHKKTYIFSLRKIENKKVEPLITIEVRDEKIIQARGHLNRSVNAIEKDIIRLWAEKENLEIRNAI